jgi:hypothetical protein
VSGQPKRSIETCLFSLLLSFVLIAAGAGCGDKPSQGDCEKLLDHIIKVEVDQAGTDQLTPEMTADLEKQKKELRAHLKKQFMSQCMDKTPGAFVQCGLKARNSDELGACDKK